MICMYHGRRWVRKIADYFTIDPNWIFAKRDEDCRATLLHQSRQLWTRKNVNAGPVTSVTFPRELLTQMRCKNNTRHVISVCLCKCTNTVSPKALAVNCSSGLKIPLSSIGASSLLTYQTANGRPRPSTSPQDGYPRT